jgi:hypothetical protein
MDESLAISLSLQNIWGAKISSLRLNGKENDGQRAINIVEDMGEP